jgi:hypothetical protein
MAYIGKSIESGTFSVLDTSGNTYNGSNTTFNLGTQVGSVAQLLVSHDGVIQKPGTDYTLASGGTQITFTTAPASGASIFIVEISGAVGGPLDSDLNGTELILDADGDTSLHASTDDQIDIKIAGADDFAFKANTFEVQTGSNIDMNGTELILDADGDTSITADTDDRIDFKIGGADDLKMTANAINVLSGTTLTIDSGATITNSGTANGFGALAGIDDQSSSNDDQLTITDTAVVINEDSDDVDFRVESNGNANMLFVNGGTDQVIFGANSTTDITFDTVVAIEGTGSNSPVLRIDTNATNKTAELHLVNNDSSGASSGASIAFYEGTTRQTYLHHSFNGGYFQIVTTGGEVFRINEGGTVASGDFNDTSDRGLKENIADIADGTSIIKQLKPRTFKWKGEKADRGDSAGFIAQEVKEVLPNLIDGEEYDDSKPLEERNKLSVRTHGIVSYLTKALQESIAKIEALETRVTTLEG